jgi:hypothetical protein
MPRIRTPREPALTMAATPEASLLLPMASTWAKAASVMSAPTLPIRIDVTAKTLPTKGRFSEVVNMAADHAERSHSATAAEAGERRSRSASELGVHSRTDAAGGCWLQCMVRQFHSGTLCSSTRISPASGGAGSLTMGVNARNIISCGRRDPGASDRPARSAASTSSFPDDHRSPPTSECPQRPNCSNAERPGSGTPG